MPTINFVQTVTTTPPVQVAGVNVSYNELLNSLGSFYFLLKEIYLDAGGSYAQINEPITFDKYDVSGKKDIKNITPAVDPYSSQAAIYLDVKEQGFVLDGQLIITPTLLPQSRLRIILFCQEGSLSQKLDRFSKSNFKRLDV